MRIQNRNIVVLYCQWRCSDSLGMISGGAGASVAPGDGEREQNWVYSLEECGMTEPWIKPVSG